MSDAWQSIKIQEFEQVLAGASTALLRVTAKPSRRRPVADRRPVLAANDGLGVHRFVALPAPTDNRGVLRAAYSVPVELVGPETGFSLELGEGRFVALPAPTPGAARLSSGPPAEGASEPARDAGNSALPDGGERRSDPIDKLAELSAALAAAERLQVEHAEARTAAEAEVATLRSARVQSQQELEQSRDAVRIMTFERDELSRQAAAFDDVAIKARERAAQAEAANEKSEAMLNELQTWRGELERRLAATTTELAAVKAGRQEDERQLDQLRGELIESEAKVELAQSELRRLNDDASEAERKSSAAGEAELARMTAELEQLRATQAEAAAEAEAALAEEAARAASFHRDDAQASGRIRALESERRQIAEQARELANLLEPAGRLAELASELARARERAENLHAATAVPLAPQPAGEAPAESSSAPPAAAAAPGADGAGLAEARAEIQALRAKLERAHAANESDQLELIRLSAEADARLEAERELTRAAERRSER